MPGAVGALRVWLWQDTQCHSWMILSGPTEPLDLASWETCGFGGDFSGKSQHKFKENFALFH